MVVAVVAVLVKLKVYVLNCNVHIGAHDGSCRVGRRKGMCSFPRVMEKVGNRIVGGCMTFVGGPKLTPVKRCSA